MILMNLNAVYQTRKTMLNSVPTILEQVDAVLEELDRTPAWLCRRAGVHRCNYTLIRNGQQKLSENLKNKFSDILGIKKEILFTKQESK